MTSGHASNDEFGMKKGKCDKNNVKIKYSKYDPPNTNATPPTSGGAYGDKRAESKQELLKETARP